MKWGERMHDHTERDTEMWSSEYAFGNKNNAELRKYLLYPVVLWMRDLQK